MTEILTILELNLIISPSYEVILHIVPPENLATQAEVARD